MFGLFSSKVGRTAYYKYITMDTSGSWKAAEKYAEITNRERLAQLITEQQADANREQHISPETDNVVLPLADWMDDIIVEQI